MPLFAAAAGKTYLKERLKLIKVERRSPAGAAPHRPLCWRSDLIPVQLLELALLLLGCPHLQENGEGMLRDAFSDLTMFALLKHFDCAPQDIGQLKPATLARLCVAGDALCSIAR